MNCCQAKKKKKGDPEQEFRREPPQVTTLATFHIPLAEFLEGEYEFTSVFTQGGVEIAPSTVRSAGSAEHIRKVRSFMCVWEGGEMGGGN